MVKHIPYNPHIYEIGTPGPSVIDLIPEGYALDKIVPVNNYWSVLVCHKESSPPSTRKRPSKTRPARR